MRGYHEENYDGSRNRFGALLTLSTVSAARADVIPTIWGNQAGPGNLIEWDKTTGATLNNFFPGYGNGRGIVKVDNILYSTVAGSNNVFKTDATTGTPLGIAFSVAGASGLQAISYDGTNFWVGDYSGVTTHISIRQPARYSELSLSPSLRGSTTVSNILTASLSPMSSMVASPELMATASMTLYWRPAGEGFHQHR